MVTTVVVFSVFRKSLCKLQFVVVVAVAVTVAAAAVAAAAAVIEILHHSVRQKGDNPIVNK